MSPDWRDVIVFEGEDTTFGEWVASLREAVVTEGEAAEAFSLLYESVVGLHQAGLDTEALGVLEELASFIGPDDVPPEAWPWFFNGVGMANGGLGRYEEAEAAYMRMQELGEQLEDEVARKHVVSTAQQNRGINALDAGDPERAIPFLTDAGQAKRELEDYVAALDILNVLAMAVAARGDLEKAERMLSDVIKLAERMEDPRRAAAGLGNRGALKARRGNYEDAEQDLRQTLVAVRREGDQLRELQSMMGVGTALGQQGRFGQALRWYRRAARLATERGMLLMEVQLRRRVALTLLDLHRAADAEPEMRHALELAQQLNHAKLTAQSLADLGALYVELGDYEQATQALNEARTRFSQVDDPVWHSQVLRNLAEMAVQTDGPAAADELWEEAVGVLDDYPATAAETAHRAAEAWLFARAAGGESRTDFATVRERAEYWLRVELDRATAFERDSAMAWRTASAGALLNWRDRNEGGLRLLEEALAEYEKLDEPVPESEVRMDIAVALTDLGRHEEAVAIFEQCIQDATERSDRVTRQRGLGNLGEVYRRQGELEKALTVLEESGVLAQALDDEEARARNHASLGLVLVQTGVFDEAEKHYHGAYELARKHGPRETVAQALGGLGNIALARGRPAAAAGYFRRAAKLYEGLWSVGLVEDLGGLAHSLAATGKHEERQQVVQKLIDVAQDTDLREKAADEIDVTARTLLGRGQLEEAAELYTVSFRLRLGIATVEQAPVAPVKPEPEDQEEGGLSQESVNTLVFSLGILITHVEVDLPEDDREPFYELVLTTFEGLHEGLAELTRPWLQMVRDEYEEQGVFDDLRKAQADE